jgi:hypothetical protein
VKDPLERQHLSEDLNEETESQLIRRKNGSRGSQKVRSPRMGNWKYWEFV